MIRCDICESIVKFVDIQICNECDRFACDCCSRIVRVDLVEDVKVPVSVCLVCEGLAPSIGFLGIWETMFPSKE